MREPRLYRGEKAWRIFDFLVEDLTPKIDGPFVKWRYYPESQPRQSLFLHVWQWSSSQPRIEVVPRVVRRCVRQISEDLFGNWAVMIVCNDLAEHIAERRRGLLVIQIVEQTGKLSSTVSSAARDA